MKKNIMTAAVAMAAMVVLGASTQADTVDVPKDIMAAPIIASGSNTGGLDFDVNTESANGSDALNFLLTVVDGDNGDTYEAIVALSTADGDGTIFSNVAGRISMGTQVSLLTGTLGTVTQTVGTGGSLTFDGFSAVNADQWTLATDTLTIGGASYAGNVVADAMPLDLSANLGSTFDATGANQWRIGEFTAQFTTTPGGMTVPEPSSIALLGLVGLAGIVRRKRA